MGHLQTPLNTIKLVGQIFNFFVIKVCDKYVFYHFKIVKESALRPILLGPQGDQGTQFYREAGFAEWSCERGHYLTGYYACPAETVQRGSRERLPFLFGLIEAGLGTGP